MRAARDRLRGARRLQVGPVLVLTLVWVALWGAPTPITVAGGLLVAAGVLVLFPLPPLALGIRVRPVALARLVLRFAVDLVVASLRMAYCAVAPWVHPRGRFVVAPLSCGDDLLATLTAEMTGLIPGTIVVDLDTARAELLVHVFDAPDDAAVAATLADIAGQERRVLAAFPPRTGGAA